MKKIFLLLLLSIFFRSGAQNETDSTKKDKIVYRYAGIQANLLLQQFISFNSNSSINTNPYLFSISKNNIKTGQGTVFGTGFNISDISSNDGVSATSVRNMNISVRFGY